MSIMNSEDRSLVVKHVLEKVHLNYAECIEIMDKISRPLMVIDGEAIRMSPENQRILIRKLGKKLREIENISKSGQGIIKEIYRKLGVSEES